MSVTTKYACDICEAEIPYEQASHASIHLSIGGTHSYQRFTIQGHLCSVCELRLGIRRPGPDEKGPDPAPTREEQFEGLVRAIVREEVEA